MKTVVILFAMIGDHSTWALSAEFPNVAACKQAVEELRDASPIFSRVRAICVDSRTGKKLHKELEE